MRGAPELAVVMPTRNEGAALETVVREWVAELRRQAPDFELLVLDDGSTDETAGILARLQSEIKELRAVDKENSGHGRTCCLGYRLALSDGARWILQIDSDGQCDPRDFSPVWAARAACPAVFGFRVRREDGWRRQLISRCARLAVFLAAGAWIQDANVPYRLVGADALRRALEDGGCERVGLSNIWLSIRLQRDCGISWVPIRFRPRRRPSPVRWRFFLAEGLRLFRELRTVSKTVVNELSGR